MSTTPSSSASVTFHTPEFVTINPRRAESGTTWLVLGHEVFEERGDDEDGERRLPGRAEVEAVMFGTPAELRALALRMVAAIEAEWPETATEMVYAFAADLYDERGTYLRTVREDMDDEDRCSNGECNCTTMERVEADALTLVEPS